MCETNLIIQRIMTKKFPFYPFFNGNKPKIKYIELKKDTKTVADIFSEAFREIEKIDRIVTHVFVHPHIIKKDKNFFDFVKYDERFYFWTAEFFISIDFDKNLSFFVAEEREENEGLVILKLIY